MDVYHVHHLIPQPLSALWMSPHWSPRSVVSAVQTAPPGRVCRPITDVQKKQGLDGYTTWSYSKKVLKWSNRNVRNQALCHFRYGGIDASWPLYLETPACVHVPIGSIWILLFNGGFQAQNPWKKDMDWSPWGMYCKSQWKTMDLKWLKRLKWLRNLGPFEVQSEIFGVRSLSTLLWYQHGTNLHHAEGWWSFPTGRYHCHWNQGHRLVVTSHSNRFSMKMLSYVPKWDCLSQFFSIDLPKLWLYTSHVGFSQAFPAQSIACRNLLEDFSSGRVTVMQRACRRLVIGRREPQIDKPETNTIPMHINI